MPDKLTLAKLETMTAREIANYLTGITQTPICRDEKYCKAVLKIFAKARK